MAYALIDSVQGASADALSATTGTLNSTGATFVTAAVAQYDGAGDPTLTDTYGNVTWVPLTAWVASGSTRVQLYYHAGPVVGSGHAFTVTGGADTYPALAVQAWSGAHLTSAYDTPNQNGKALDLDHTAGSVTPSQTNCVVISAVAFDIGDPGWTLSGSVVDEEVAYGPGTNYGLVLAHLIQTTAAVANGTWAHGAAESYFEMSAQAVFAPAPAAGGLLRQMLMQHGG